MSYYAYILTNNNTQGIVTSWEECKQIIKNNKSRYKKFDSEEEAKKWLDDGAEYEKREKK